MTVWNIVGFEVSNVAKGQFYFVIIQFYPSSIISPTLHIHSLNCHTLHNRWKWEWRWASHLKRRTINISQYFVWLHTKWQGVRSKESCISISTSSRTSNTSRKVIQCPLFAACFLWYGCLLVWFANRQLTRGLFKYLKYILIQLHKERVLTHYTE
jgi:hypothetical protein